MEWKQAGLYYGDGGGGGYGYGNGYGNGNGSGYSYGGDGYGNGGTYFYVERRVVDREVYRVGYVY